MQVSSEKLDEVVVTALGIERDAKSIGYAVQKVPGEDLLIARDESALTGESIPSQKEDLVLNSETIIADRRNMGYSSTLVTYGSAQGLVIASGDRTEYNMFPV